MTGADRSHGAQMPLILFVAGDSPRSLRARANLRDALAGAGAAREIDLLETPEAAFAYGLFATPALLRLRSDGTADGVLYGDLSETAGLERFIAEVGARRPTDA